MTTEEYLVARKSKNWKFNKVVEDMMKLFGFLKLPDINEGVEKCRTTEGAVLLDVRDPQEYASGHIPGAVNIPKDGIAKAKEMIPDADTPVFAYCYSGRRSDMAVTALKKMGYTNARNIGGITAYQGSLEK